MRFFTVADRELRAAARRPAAFRARWITAAVFFGLLLWCLWGFNAFRSRRAGSEIFEVLSVLTFIYCLIVGTAMTADCLSSERREGTLGLLYLTNLNSLEIVVGKLFSSALSAVYGLVAIFPILAMPVMMGGVSFAVFGKTILALVVTIFFSLACGFVASALCKRQFTAIAMAMGFALVYGMGLMAVATILDQTVKKFSLADELASFCPLYTLMAARTRVFGDDCYWFSVAAVLGVTLLWMALVVWRLAWTWRDQPKSRRLTKSSPATEAARSRRSARHAAWRRRLLDINPFYWLAGQRRISSPIFMIWALAVVALTALVAGPFFGLMFRGQSYAPVLGNMFAWVWGGLAIHALTTYYAAMVASQRLAEDKQTGALELILSTPTTERTIERGLWLAYARRMFFPVSLAVLVHFFFVWQVMTMIMLDPPGRDLPPGTAWQIFWGAVFAIPVNGVELEWMYTFMMRGLLLALVTLFVLWITLGWLGRWLGLRMKHPGFAPIVALAITITPPVLLFSAICFLADEFNWDRMPERQFIPFMMWLAFAIGVGHCALVSGWASRRLRRDFRTVVMNRYAPPARRRWIPRWRTVWRFAAGTTALGVAVVLVIVSYFAYQNWRSKRDWAAFQAKIKQKGESLAVAPLLPAVVVADSENFARSPAYPKLRSNKSTPLETHLGNLQTFNIASTAYGNNNLSVEWVQQQETPLNDAKKWLSSKKITPKGTNRVDYAEVLLQSWKPYEANLRELAADSRRPFFQTTIGRDGRAVLQNDRDSLLPLEFLHFMFAQRACALLAVQRTNEAAEDVLTSLRLTQHARQAIDTHASLRMQFMAARSLQPIWEGLAENRWNAQQLAEFQTQLAAFNFLSDYTNAVRRAVLAHIEAWAAIPESKNSKVVIPQGSGFVQRDEWTWQPRAWWYDYSIQLYQAGQNAIANVDVAAGRIQQRPNWSDLSGLVLDGETHQLLQQNAWWRSNPSSVSFAQTAVNQSAIACALERFRLATGGYPENLEALLPAYLDKIPNDIVRGRPMIYERVDSGRYVLRGVGTNEKDDRKSKFSDDWLWAYPTNTPAATTPIKKPTAR